MGFTEATGKLARWRLRVQEFEYDTLHRPGIIHRAPDALSRLPTNGHDTNPLNDEVPVFTISDTNDPLYPEPNRDIRNAPTIIHSISEMQDESKANDANLRVLCDEETDLVKFRQERKLKARGDDPILRSVLIKAQCTD